MSLKVKLTSTILAFCLILGLLVMGVFATSQATVNLGGSLTFMATNVYAKVTGTISGTASATQPELDDIYIDDETIEGDIDTWASQDLAFKDDGTAITIEVTIENLATDRPLYVSALDTVGIVDNVTKTIANGAFVLEEQGSGNESKTITITLKVSDLNTSLPADALYGYKFELLDESGVLSSTDSKYENKLLFNQLTEDTVSVVTAGVNVEGDPSENTYTLTGDVVIPAYVKYDGKVCSVAEIGSFAFGFPDGSGCSLNSLTLPNTIKSISTAAFANCSITKGIVLPDSLTTLVENAFTSFRVTSIIIPNSVTEIGPSCFCFCSELENLRLPNNGQITKIQYETFTGCSKLKMVFIPKSVIEIERAAFGECTLTDVYYEGTEEEWNAITISDENDANDALKSATIHFNSK